jgi:hypothetical protein
MALHGFRRPLTFVTDTPIQTCSSSGVVQEPGASVQAQGGPLPCWAHGAGSMNASGVAEPRAVAAGRLRHHPVRTGRASVDASDMSWLRRSGDLPDRGHEQDRRAAVGVRDLWKALLQRGDHDSVYRVALVVVAEQRALRTALST